MGNTSYINVPASTLLRLQRILSLLQDHCQKSSDFCSIMCRTGIITELINGLLILYACQSHHSVDFEWVSGYYVGTCVAFVHVYICTYVYSYIIYVYTVYKHIRMYIRTFSEQCMDFMM